MPAIAPPWVAMVQAHADQAQARLDARADQIDDYHATQNLDYAIRHGRRAGDENTARDLANAAVDDITVGRTAKHRARRGSRVTSECRHCMAATYTLAEHQAGVCTDCPTRKEES